MNTYNSMFIYSNSILLLSLGIFLSLNIILSCQFNHHTALVTEFSREVSDRNILYATRAILITVGHECTRVSIHSSFLFISCAVIFYICQYRWLISIGCFIFVDLNSILDILSLVIMNC
jgi:hypothetical protein